MRTLHRPPAFVHDSKNAPQPQVAIAVPTEAAVNIEVEQEALEQVLTGNPMTPTQVWTATPGQ